MFFSGLFKTILTFEEGGAKGIIIGLLMLSVTLGFASAVLLDIILISKVILFVVCLFVCFCIFWRIHNSLFFRFIESTEAQARAWLKQKQNSHPRSWRMSTWGGLPALLPLLPFSLSSTNLQGTKVSGMHAASSLSVSLPFLNAL